MRKIFLLCILTLAGAPAAFSQENEPMLDSGFGIKPFSDPDYISPYTIKQSIDGGFYLGGEYGLLRLDAAGNRLWSLLYPTVESSGWLTSAEGNIAVDSVGNVYVCINTYLWEPHVLKYDPQGNLLKDQILPVTSPDSDPAVFGVAYSSNSQKVYAAFSYWSAAREGYVAAILMFDEDLNPVKNVVGPAGIDWSYGSVTGIGVDKNDNVYVGGSRTGSFIYVLEYDADLNLKFEFSKDPIAPKMFIGGETIPNGGYYIINNEFIDNTLHNISASGAEQWFRLSGLDIYIHAVDGGGNFYGVDNSQTPQLSKLGYADGTVKWAVAEPHSAMIDALFVDGQDRIYTAGYLAEPVGDKDSYIARYTQGGAQDTTAPSPIADLAAVSVTTNSITVSWTAPGDDGATGTAAGYDVRYTAAGQISSDADFTAATQAQGEPAPQAAGGAEIFTLTGLTPGTTYFLALKTADEAGNISGLSNCVSAETCVEVTGVPNWKQYKDDTDPTNTWHKEDYDHTTSKISALGCLLTAAAQVAKKYGYNTDPGRLNETLKNTVGGFDGKFVYLPAMVDAITASGVAVQYKKTTGTDVQMHLLLEDGLKNGNPVILELYSASRLGRTHFVVVAKKCGDVIYINDPGNNNTRVTTLADYFNLITNGNPKKIISVRMITKGTI